MSKNGRNEKRKVVAGFLNGTAVAVLIAGCITPLLTHDPRWWVPILAFVVGLIAHVGAVSVVGGLED